MTESIADRTYRAALDMWQSSAIRGKRPAREDYDHLNASPAAVEPLQATATVAAHGQDAHPSAVDAATAAAVKAALNQVHADLPRGAAPQGTDSGG